MNETEGLLVLGALALLAVGIALMVWGMLSVLCLGAL